MDMKKDVREFLTSRRARITPEQVGLVSYGRRRVPGLRREEVAVLAGVSVPYYTRLERGDINGVSQNVLEALARALELDDAERAHLFDLARAAQPTGARPLRRQGKQRVRPEVQWTLDAITGAAAFVGNNRLDLLTANQLGRALFSELYAAPARPTTGSASPTGASRPCAGLPAATRTTATSQTSSASSQQTARRSAPAGPRTTCASTTPASSTSTTQSSATSA
jgi:transcriptional regulator with XRE-family HTH domain